MDERLAQNVSTLAELRKKIEEAEFAVEITEREFQETALGQALADRRATLDDLMARAKELDNQIRSYTVSIFENTGERHPHPAVGVRVYTKLQYDKDEALHWSQRHLPKALKLDKRFFEKHAKGVAETQPIPFVQIVEEPRATVSSDLSEYVEEA